MILGIGTDLANIERIQGTLNRFGDRFKNRVFTAIEQGVTNMHSGQPMMALTGWAAERLVQMTPEGHTAVIHCTLTDDHPWAQAFVVIEARLDMANRAATPT
jgi:holo-[acyl-carrier protein] synthase